MAKKKTKKLYRAKEKNSMIAGVCAGIANYSSMDPTIIRLLWIILALVSFGIGVLAYLLAWVIIPRK